MKKKTRFNKNTVIIALVSWLCLVAFLLPSARTYAQGRAEVCQGLSGSTTCPDGEAAVRGVVDAALNILSIIIGIAGVIMVMLGGFKYITSGGDTGKTASAQNTIIWALVGLAIAALAQDIVRFVLGRI